MDKKTISAFFKNTSPLFLLVLLLATGGVFVAVEKYVNVKATEGRNEDLYWSVAQLQIEMEKSRAELYRLESGKTSLDQAKTRLALAKSRYLDFITPSTTVHHMLKEVDGFSDIVADLNDFFNDKNVSALSAASAQEIIDKIDTIRPDLAEFAVHSRISEVSHRDARNQDLARQRRLVSYLWFALWGFICATVLVLMYRYNAARKDAASRQVQLEEEREAHKATVSAELERTTFLATLSHEIRSPLQSMQVCVELIEPNIKGPSNAYTALQRLKTSMSHLMTQVHDIMDISAIKNMQFRLSPEDLDVTALLRETIEAQQAMSDIKGLTLAFEFTALPDKVKLDGTRLRQIVGNLVSNAIRYTDQGGVTVSACTLGIEGHNYLEIRVKDTGIGIPEDFQSRIFQPFIQGRSRRVGSSGLGLAVVKELVGLFGGVIELESEEGKGSEFTVRLPINKMASESDVLQTILIVDDDENIKEPFAELLTMTGYEVATAGSATEAIQAIRDKTFSVILLDMQLGKESGYSVADAVRKSARNKSAPIMAMTAYPEEYADARSAWFVEKLEKPFDFNRLRILMKSHLG